jgi:3-oxoacyl-[acyl-carrier-protein] synthase II
LYAAIIPEASALMRKYYVSPLIKSNTLYYALTLASTEQALLDSKLPIESLSIDEQYRIGVMIGSSASDKPPAETALNELRGRNYHYLNKMILLQVLTNLGSSLVALRYGFKGYSGTPVVACASGLVAIIDAARVIKEGLADVMIAGGAEQAVSPFILQGFSSLKALSTKYSATPNKSSRPFDTHRDGLILGDGTGILMLEVSLS